MDNKNQSSSPDAGQAEEGKAPGRTLDMQNISISTMKEDIAKDSPPEDKKGGWFDFMAKRKEVNGQNKDKNVVEEPQPLKTEQTPANQEIPGTSLDKELEEFKEENEQLAEKPFADTEQPKSTIAETEEILPPSDKVEAPPNLPVSEKPSFADTTENKPSFAPAMEGKPVKKMTGTKEAPLESISEPSGREDDGLSIPDIQGKLKEALGGEIKMETVSKIKPINEGVEATLQGETGGTALESKPSLTEEAATDKLTPENPFSTRIQPKEPEKKSLLSSVEAALNYSAPPEFSKEREAVAEAPEGGGPVIDLRKETAAGPLAGIMANKKLLMIGGGVIGLVLIIGITLVFVLGGKSKTETPKMPVTTTPAGNQNQNQNPVTPIKTVTQTPPTVSAKKVLNNALEVSFESENDIGDELEKYRQNKSVAKQSQLVFMKSDGSSATFQDLMDATGVMVPRNILTQPSSEPALIFVDFFHGNTIFGLVIPVKDNEELTMSKLKDWESTMVIDLSDLWKGINIDNKGAYFADSQIFTGGRFALIDKKQGLSLDYLFQEGYVLIAPGKDSMTILKKQFTPPAGSSSSSSIKWEEESSTTVSGVNSNSSTTLRSNENVNSQ